MLERAQDRCLDENDALALVQGTLATTVHAHKQSHIDHCEACRKLVATLVQMSSIRRAAPVDTEATTVPFEYSGIDDAMPAAITRRYVVGDVLGTGAMGVVYAARDTVLDRDVAIKLLRATRGASERLAREAQAMAQLSHPSVVTVFDAGIADDRAYIIMERVHGSTLRAWLAETRRSRSQIVDAFEQAARGLAAGHAAGIIHGDFKPDNVLVDPSGRARVSDFGLARTIASHDELARHGELAGTPVYMAPEQLDGAAPTAACDQHAFGASLYEALRGVRPYGGPTLAELREQQRSGCRLDDMPRVLARILRRCLAEDPASRFASMDDVADALQKTRRRRVHWIAGGVATAAVAAILAVALRPSADAPEVCPTSPKATRVWAPHKRLSVQTAFLATRKPFARQAWLSTERALDGYVEAWTAASGEACEATHVHHTQSEAVLDLRSQCLDARLAELSALVDVLANADPQVVEKAVEATTRLTTLAYCTDTTALRDRVPAPTGLVERDKLARVNTELAQAKALDDAGKFAGARGHVATAVGLAREVGYKPAEAGALLRRGSLEHALGDYKAADATLGDAVIAAQAGRDTALAAEAYTLLIAVQTRQAHYDAANESSRHALSLLEGLGVQSAPQVAAALSNTGALLLQQAKWDDGLAALKRAAAMFEHTAGANDIRLASTLNNMAIALALRGAKKDALEHARRSFAIRERALGPDHPDVAAAWFTLGTLYSAQGERDNALAAYRRCLAIQEATLGAEHPLVARTLSNLGRELHMADQLEPAIAMLRRALAIREKVLGADHPDVARTLINLGEVYRQRADPTTAIGHYQRALAIAEVKLPPKAPEVAVSIVGIGLCELAAGAPERAVAPLERAVALLQTGMANELAPAEFGLARAVWDARREHDRARTLARKALDRYVALDRASDRAEIDRIRTWLQQHGGR